MCLCYCWHRELGVGNSSKLLFRHEFVSKQRGAGYSMSRKTLFEKSASAIVYVQNLFQGCVGWMLPFLEIWRIWHEVQGSMDCLTLKSYSSSVCLWSASWSTLQPKVNVMSSGNRMPSHTVVTKESFVLVLFVLLFCGAAQEVTC